MYFVTDNTYLELEKAVLLSNCQLTSCKNSIYNSNKGDIANQELSVEFQCMPITGAKVDQAAKKLLQAITGVKVTQSTAKTSYEIVAGKNDKIASLNSNGYEYANMKKLKLTD